MSRRKVICENCSKWERNNKLTGWCNSKRIGTDARKRRICYAFIDPIDKKLQEIKTANENFDSLLLSVKEANEKENVK